MSFLILPRRIHMAAFVVALALSTPLAVFAQGFGSALQFSTDSSPDFVVAADRPAFNFGTGDFTLEFWLSKPNPRKETILNKRVGCSANSYWAIIATTTLQFSIRQNSTTVAFIDGSTVISDGAWRHVAAVRQGTTIRLYLDGELNGTATSASVVNLSNTGDVFLGTGPCDPGTSDPVLHFSGAADEVMVWGTARTEAEIRGDRNGTRTGSESGLLLYWRFNEGSGQVAGDASPNGVTGQLGSSASPDTADPTWITSGAVAHEASAPSPSQLVFDVSPNPVRSVADVSFALEEPGSVRLEVLDLLGREVLRRDMVRTAGTETVQISTRGLLPGVYLVRLSTPNGTAARAITVIR